MTINSFTCAILLCLSLLNSACASTTLTVRHMDPTAPVAQIWIDGELRAEVSYGEDVDITIEPGPHAILAAPPKAKSNAWSPDKAPWHLTIQNTCTLTLMTPSQRLKQE